MYRTCSFIWKRWLTLLIIFILLVGSIPLNNAQAASNFKIYDYTTKKTTTYQGSTPAYIIDGTKISLSKTPAMINSDGYALAPYSLLRDGLELKCSYKGSAKTLTIKKGKNKLVMTVGSKTAYLNGTAVSMGAAPMRIKYKSSGLVRTLIPTRFVTETFGYQYNWNASNSTVTIKSPLHLNYDGIDVDYTGTEGKVTADGKKVDLSTCPSIIIADNAMLQAKQVFSNSGLGIEFTYNKKTGEILFEIGEIKLLMTLDSTDAYLNDTLLKSEVPPRMITNRDTGYTHLFVPGRFVAENLGFDYTWDSANATSIIKTTDHVGIPPVMEDIVYDSEETEPTITPAVYFDWKTSDVYAPIITALQGMSHQDISLQDTGNSSFLSTVYKENTEQNHEVYYILFTAPISKFTQYQQDNKFVFQAPNTNCADSTYQLGGTFVSDIKTAHNIDDMTSTITFNMPSSNFSYGLELTADNTCAVVTVYPNYMTGVTAGIDTKGEYLTLKGLSPIAATLSEDNGYLTVKLPYTINAVAGSVYDTGLTGPLNYCLINSTDQASTEIMVKIPDARPIYTASMEGNTYTIYFNGSQQNDNNQDSGQTTPPAVQTSLLIPLPEGVELSMVEDYDYYYNNQICLELPGDHSGFYEENPIPNVFQNVKNITVGYLTNHKTRITFTTSKVQGYRISKSSGGFTINIDNPSKIYSKIVVLDAGHGGTDPGTVHGGYNEKDMNFSILYHYAKPLFEASDIKAYFSRYDDTLIPLETRAAYASKVEADLFISLHQNSNNNTAAMGTSIYYSTVNKGKTASGLTSEKMASIFLSSLTKAMGTKNRGIIDKGFVVVRDNTVPAVLLELAFMSNPMELALIRNPNFQQKAGETIYQTVVDIFHDYPTGR